MHSHVLGVVSCFSRHSEVLRLTCEPSVRCGDPLHVFRGKVASSQIVDWLGNSLCVLEIREFVSSCVCWNEHISSDGFRFFAATSNSGPHVKVRTAVQSLPPDYVAVYVVRARFCCWAYEMHRTSTAPPHRELIVEATLPSHCGGLYGGTARVMYGMAIHVLEHEVRSATFFAPHSYSALLDCAAS